MRRQLNLGFLFAFTLKLVFAISILSFMILKEAPSFAKEPRLPYQSWQ